MAEKRAKAGNTVADVHGITHVHADRSLGAQLFPGAFHTAGGLTNCFIRDGTTGSHQDFGNSFSETFRAGIGPGFDCVNVQLAGWDLNFTKKDHHIDRIRVRIHNVNYDPGTGEVSFTVSGHYRDKNGDDDFEWEVWFTILALG